MIHKHRKNTSLLEKYLLIFFKKFEHAFHVNERVLDHSAEKKDHKLITITRINVN